MSEPVRFELAVSPDATRAFAWRDRDSEVLDFSRKTPGDEFKLEVKTEHFVGAAWSHDGQYAKVLSNGRVFADISETPATVLVARDGDVALRRVVLAWSPLGLKLAMAEEGGSGRVHVLFMKGFAWKTTVVEGAGSSTRWSVAWASESTLVTYGDAGMKVHLLSADTSHVTTSILELPTQPDATSKSKRKGGKSTVSLIALGGGVVAHAYVQKSKKGNATKSCVTRFTPTSDAGDLKPTHVYICTFEQDSEADHFMVAAVGDKRRIACAVSNSIQILNLETGKVEGSVRGDEIAGIAWADAARKLVWIDKRGTKLSTLDPRKIASGMSSGTGGGGGGEGKGGGGSGDSTRPKVDPESVAQEVSATIQGVKDLVIKLCKRIETLEDKLGSDKRGWSRELQADLQKARGDLKKVQNKLTSQGKMLKICDQRLVRLLKAIDQIAETARGEVDKK